MQTEFLKLINKKAGEKAEKKLKDLHDKIKTELNPLAQMGASRR